MSVITGCASPSIELFSTCPASTAVPSDTFIRCVTDVARWSEQCGYSGILVYSDNTLADPWVVAQIILENTKVLNPLVAVQPVYMHPYTVAKTVATLSSLYRRRIHLNMVAGGFKNDLEAMNDTTPHDERYERLIEYTTIIQDLIRNSRGNTFTGKFYTVRQLRLTPHLPPEHRPGLFVSGSSDAGVMAAKALGAIAVKYPRPAMEEALGESDNCGLRIGIIARPRASDAWEIARARFPEDRQGQLRHTLAVKTTDSQWHQQLSQLPAEDSESPYWLVPFQHYKTMCPYLVGSVEVVAEEIARYLALGFRKFILDVPATYEDLVYATTVFDRALEPSLR